MELAFMFALLVILGLGAAVLWMRRQSHEPLPPEVVADARRHEDAVKAAAARQREADLAAAQIRLDAAKKRDSVDVVNEIVERRNGRNVRQP